MGDVGLCGWRFHGWLLCCGVWRVAAAVAVCWPVVLGAVELSARVCLFWACICWVCPMLSGLVGLGVWIASQLF